METRESLHWAWCCISQRCMEPYNATTPHAPCAVPRHSEPVRVLFDNAVLSIIGKGVARRAGLYLARGGNLNGFL